MAFLQNSRHTQYASDLPDSLFLRTRLQLLDLLLLFLIMVSFGLKIHHSLSSDLIQLCFEFRLAGKLLFLGIIGLVLLVLHLLLEFLDLPELLLCVLDSFEQSVLEFGVGVLQFDIGIGTCRLLVLFSVFCGVFFSLVSSALHFLRESLLKLQKIYYYLYNLRHVICV